MAAGKAAEIFENFGIENGRADLIHAHGPLAKIDLAASVTAEREILIGGADDHPARRALEDFC